MLCEISVKSDSKCNQRLNLMKMMFNTSKKSNQIVDYFLNLIYLSQILSNQKLVM